MPWREQGLNQKLRRCKICDQWDVRMNRNAEYRMLRYFRENKGIRQECYAHPHCLEKQYGKMWELLLADRSEVDRLEGRNPRPSKQHRSKRQKDAEESSSGFED